MAASPADGVLEARAFPGSGDPAYLLPVPTRETRPFFDALAGGTLALQRCAACSRFRYPVGPVCPYCGGASFPWQPVSGRGSVHSWIRYHKCYVPELESQMPYVVLSVQLDEGPRIFGRLADTDVEPEVGMPVRAIVERWPGGQCVHAFVARAPGT
jgi:uncharacterized OB-fold protein